MPVFKVTTPRPTLRSPPITSAPAPSPNPARASTSSALRIYSPHLDWRHSSQSEHQGRTSKEADESQPRQANELMTLPGNRQPTNDDRTSVTIWTGSSLISITIPQNSLFLTRSLDCAGPPVPRVATVACPTNSVVRLERHIENKTNNNSILQWLTQGDFFWLAVGAGLDQPRVRLAFLGWFSISFPAPALHCRRALPFCPPRTRRRNQPPSGCSVCHLHAGFALCHFHSP